MNQSSEKISGDDFDKSTFSVVLPLEDSLANNLKYLIEKLWNISDQKMLCAQQCLEDYEKELFLRCIEFSVTSLESIMFTTRAQMKNLHFIYRIDLMQDWKSELTLKGANGVLIRNTYYSSAIMEEFYHSYSLDILISEQEYMVMKLLIDFNRFYMERGRIFPAYIKVLNLEPCTARLICNSMAGNLKVETI